MAANQHIMALFRDLEFRSVRPIAAYRHWWEILKMPGLSAGSIAIAPYLG
jgi:hypothetical protein